MLTIKILGIGCSNCQKVEEIARQASAEMSLEALFEKVKEPERWKKYALLATPGLVVNEKLVCAGRIPNVGEVCTWLADAQMLMEA